MSAPLRALTVRQPWAELIVSGAKPVENRTWYTAHRGLLVIHAAARRDRTATIPAGVEVEPLTEGLPLGAVVGIATLVDVTEGVENPWAEADQRHWVLAEARRLAAPIPALGALGLWSLDNATDQAIRRQLRLPTAEETS